MAWVPDEQAVQVAELGPLAPQPDGDMSGSQVDDRSRDEERRDLPRPPLHQRRVLPLDHVESADAGADVNPDSVRDRPEPPELGLFMANSVAARANWMNRPIRLQFFFLDELKGIEALDLRRDGRAKIRSYQNV